MLESLIPALTASINNTKLPEHIKEVKCEGISQIKLIDATPIGINVRSTVATYANVHDELRKLFAKSKEAKEKGYKAGDFSYNTGKLRCPVCDGTGEITLDVQFYLMLKFPALSATAHVTLMKLMKFITKPEMVKSIHYQSLWIWM